MKIFSERDTHNLSAYTARFIENRLISIKSQDFGLGKVVSCIAVKALGLFVFPLALLGDTVIEASSILGRGVVWLFSNKSEKSDIERELSKSALRIDKFMTGFVCTPLSILATDAVSFLFLERTDSRDVKVRPFGVEDIYGLDLDEQIQRPQTKEGVQTVVREALKSNRSIAIRGSGMSQGTQTVPLNRSDYLLDLRALNSVAYEESNGIGYARVGPGALWEEVQKVVNQHGKSVIVKQASDLFSVGGSIGINCHGWAHDAGAISSVVDELTIVDAQGNLKTLSRTENEEHFKAMFGTFGHFGVIVEAKIRLTDNVMMKESGVKIPLENFHQYYQAEVQNKKDSLLMGRLSVDPDHLLGNVYVNLFEEISSENTQIPLSVQAEKTPLVTPNFELEPSRGARVERMFTTAFGHLPDFLFRPLMRYYWKREVDIMEKEQRVASRNEILHFCLKSFFSLHQSQLYAQWLQEYFVTPEQLPYFIEFLRNTLNEHDVRLLNASIRPTPKDEVSILPYAEEFRYAIVISFHQLKTKKEIEKTTSWIKKVQDHLLSNGGKWYQAYMPIATNEEFRACYGSDKVDEVVRLKKELDPQSVFQNRHTSQYYQ